MDNQRQTQKAAFTLTEVMVSAAVFTILALSASAFFIQNARISTMMRYRTQVTNMALNALEQLRITDYVALKNLYDNALANPTNIHRLTVVIADGSYVAPNPDPYLSLRTSGRLSLGQRPIDIQLNSLDGTIINTNWTTLDLAIDGSQTPVKMPARFWLTLRYNSGTNPMVEAFELALVYQWKNPGQNNAGSAGWLSNTIRLVVPSQNPSNAPVAQGN